MLSHVADKWKVFGDHLGGHRMILFWDLTWAEEGTGRPTHTS